jgi:hypothetical protein
MPRGYGRGLGRYGNNLWNPRIRAPLTGYSGRYWLLRILDIILLLALAYVVVSLFFVAAAYILALVVLVALREGIRYFGWRW